MSTKHRYSNRTKRRAKPKRSGRKPLFLALLAIIIMFGIMKFPVHKYDDVEPGTIEDYSQTDVSETESKSNVLKYEDVPEYNGNAYVEINNNAPDFGKSEEIILSAAGYEYYSALDDLGRCGYCEACVGRETMPEGDRGEIWTVHPSGWRSGQGWERCHLIAWSLTGEDANDHNLIAGTHYMNVDGMLPFEIEVAEAADKDKHVMYRVTPVYNGNELIPRGVHMIAKSVEDDSVSFNVFVYNVEPGKTVDYMTGYIK